MEADIINLKAAIRLSKWEEAKGILARLLEQHSECPFLLVKWAEVLMLSEPADECALEKAEECLTTAHRINPEDLEVVEELAHFYDVVIPDSLKASHFASIYIKRVAVVCADMNRILAGAGA